MMEMNGVPLGAAIVALHWMPAFVVIYTAYTSSCTAHYCVLNLLAETGYSKRNVLFNKEKGASYSPGHSL